MNADGIGRGQRLTVEYADHNEAFAAFLPRAGAITAELGTASAAERWFLVDLDVPFEYQLKVAEPYGFRLMVVDAFLIRSRRKGLEVGDEGDVPVSVLLVEEGHHPTGPRLDPSAFLHVAWGTCCVED